MYMYIYLFFSLPLSLSPFLLSSCKLQALVLVYANRELSQTSLHYLRNNDDYFFTQLAALPFPWSLREAEEEVVSFDIVLYLNQQAWILQAVALELRMLLSSVLITVNQPKCEMERVSGVNQCLLPLP